jgi:uncharacterized membrane protein YidH (DUF202 family)
MIRGYGDHAANERTFVAWVRTGIAVIAFGASGSRKARAACRNSRLESKSSCATPSQ